MKFNLRDQGEELFEPYQEYDCLLVKRTGNNKHITNYFALKKSYRLEERSGNLFYFKNRINIFLKVVNMKN